MLQAATLILTSVLNRLDCIVLLKLTCLKLEKTKMHRASIFFAHLGLTTHHSLDRPWCIDGQNGQNLKGAGRGRDAAVVATVVDR